MQAILSLSLKIGETELAIKIGPGVSIILLLLISSSSLDLVNRKIVELIIKYILLIFNLIV